MLVLSLFPGLGLLDMAFEEEGFCIVRGPDLLWGGDIRRFHPPAGVFDGVIGGPPCQLFSPLLHFGRTLGRRDPVNLIPEFERCVVEALPRWFLMENVPDAPEPQVAGFIVKSSVLQNRLVGGVQERARRFSFGTQYGRVLSIEIQALEPVDHAEAVTSSYRTQQISVGRPRSGRCVVDGLRRGPNWGPRASIKDMEELQGLPRGFLTGMPFTTRAKRKMLGNGVPRPMGRAIARAVKRAVTPAAAIEGAGG